jgi:hypothetical protein
MLKNTIAILAITIPLRSSNYVSLKLHQNLPKTPYPPPSLQPIPHIYPGK